MIVIFLRFVIFQGGHCDSSHRASKYLAMTLLTNFLSDDSILGFDTVYVVS
jgi:hypothetical protein